jgi:hypothetical protein
LEALNRSTSLDRTISCRFRLQGNAAGLIAAPPKAAGHGAEADQAAPARGAQQISGKFYAELMLEKHLPYTSAFAAQTVCMELKWDNWLFLLMIFI